MREPIKTDRSYTKILKDPQMKKNNYLVKSFKYFAYKKKNRIFRNK